MEKSVRMLKIQGRLLNNELRNPTLKKKYTEDVVPALMEAIQLQICNASSKNWLKL
jgi:hypothetical protein